MFRGAKRRQGLNGIRTLAWAAAPPRGCAGRGLSPRCLSDACSALPGLRALTSDVQVHTAPCSSAVQWRDAPAVETLPSALFIGHFYYLSYLRRFLACCRLYAAWGKGRTAGLSGPCESPADGLLWGRIDVSSQGLLLPWPAVVMGTRPSGGAVGRPGLE